MLRNSCQRIQVLVCVVWVLLSATLWGGDTGSATRDIALVGGKIYVSPTAAPIENGVLIVRDGKIAQIGKRSDVKVPQSAEVIDCTGKVITAGFWNSHVHFTEPVWQNAGDAPADKLEPHMQEMLTRWGFTTVFDIGSFPRDTLALRKRVDSGEVPGPKIYTTAGAIYPENGIPVYIPQPIASQIKPYEAATPADAARLARQSLAIGGDGIKLSPAPSWGTARSRRCQPILPELRSTWRTRRASSCSLIPPIT